MLQRVLVRSSRMVAGNKREKVRLVVDTVYPYQAASRKTHTQVFIWIVHVTAALSGRRIAHVSLDAWSGFWYHMLVSDCSWHWNFDLGPFCLLLQV